MVWNTSTALGLPAIGYKRTFGWAVIYVRVPLTIQMLHHLYVESGMLLQQNIKEPEG